MRLQTFVKKRPYLFWSVSTDTELSPEAIVEGVLNYGDWDDVQKLIKMLGRKKVAEIFFAGSQRRRSNYDPKIKHYFKHYFKDA